MKIKIQNPLQCLKKVYLQESIECSNFNKFKACLQKFNREIEAADAQNQTEEHYKNLLNNFLNDAFYKNKNYINTKSYKGQLQADLVIYSENNAQSYSKVIFELKRPVNKDEMISQNDINKKALHETVLYYLWEKIECNNNNVTNIVISNFYQWFVIDATEFNKCFYENNDLIKQFKQWKLKATDSIATNQMYEYIDGIIRNSDKEIEITYFEFPKNFENNQNLFSDIKINPNEEELINIYKIFSPRHLLKETLKNDSNTLNSEFYYELLYILGLEEVKESGKKIIRRTEPNQREGASLLENTIKIIKTSQKIENLKNLSDYGEYEEEQLFEISLQLCILWLNRILFLKLLEGQLISYHKEIKNYGFLNSNKIKDFDSLNTLFFNVLAINYKDRDKDLPEEFINVPYLNSSLFENSDLEIKTIIISNLRDDLLIPIYDRTVLKDSLGNSLKRKKRTTLNYLLDFLDCYDFGAESKGGLIEEKKTIINAAVLGLIFEKINGYKDGSFFTPGFVTMYMCRESIRLAVLEKFNAKYDWKCRTITDLFNKIDKIDIQEANQIINNLKICDPAVGSGHFLVSALNELIAIKSELGILCDKDGRRIKDYKIKVEDDELLIASDDDSTLFEYALNEAGIPSQKAQNLQETIFNEKLKLIENCLFGVDINPNSVNICRLRLWIELLKNAYYTKESNYKELETLPNIDVNIKCGNSLISRFGLKDNFKQSDKRIFEKYKIAVAAYKDTPEKNTKKELKRTIELIKNQFTGLLQKPDKYEEKLSELAQKLHKLNTETEMLHTEKQFQKREGDKLKIRDKIEELRQEKEAAEKDNIFRKVFEWRFEFPEVLDDDGNFEGFDIIIGNPPYIQLQKEAGKFADMLENQDYDTFVRTGDIYCIFYEKAFQLLTRNGFLTFITSNKWMLTGYGENLRKFFALKTTPVQLVDFGGLKVFESATVDTNIIMIRNINNSNQNFYACTVGRDFDIDSSLTDYFYARKRLMPEMSKDAWVITSNSEYEIKRKIESKGTPLKDWDINIYRGILTGLNEAFIIDTKKKEEIISSDPNSAEMIKPILRGRDIKRYYAKFANLWLIIIPKGFTINTMREERKNYISEPIPHYGYEDYDEAWDFIKRKYPGIANHLINYKSKAENRLDKGDYWWELRACAYYEELEKEKIVWAETVKIYLDGSRNFPRFTLLSDYYLDKTCFMLIGKDIKFILSILNSKLMEYYIKKIVMTLGKGSLGMQKSYIKEIQIPVIGIREHQPFSDLIEKIQMKKKRNITTSKEEKEIDRMVYKLYELTYEEVKTVEPEFDLTEEEYEKFVVDK